MKTRYNSVNLFCGLIAIITMPCWGLLFLIFLVISAVVFDVIELFNRKNDECVY